MAHRSGDPRGQHGGHPSGHPSGQPSGRGIFFEEADARAAVAALRGQGFEAAMTAERLAGEDDSEAIQWSVTTDGPAIALELLVESFDGWFEDNTPTTTSSPLTLPPTPLPTGPRLLKKPYSS